MTPGTKQNESKKRKLPNGAITDTAPNKRTKRQAHVRDARAFDVQTSSTAFKNGELNLDRFVKAREFEIKALEHGLQRSKKALTSRAFQQVPKDLRRRTASHNAKRVPRRLQPRAKREMVDDNTPNTSKKKLTRHVRIRLDTAKRLRSLGAKSKTKSAHEQPVDDATPKTATATTTNKANLTKNKLKQRPLPKPRFRKRQIHKSWLPTHLFHAKRARMTPPLDPLWRYALPLTPTAKCYRPTHRAATERGAIAWDTSYMATISLQGLASSIESVLSSLGVARNGNMHTTTLAVSRWKQGRRSCQAWLSFIENATETHIGPATIIWRPELTIPHPSQQRALFLRIHPSAFQQLWTQLVNLCDAQKPRVVAEDLRFEVGSIVCTGPGATEAMQSALWPRHTPRTTSDAAHDSAAVWQSLQGIENPAVLPAHALLSFDILDPRLRFPPRPPSTTHTHDQSTLLTTLVDWPPDKSPMPASMFSTKARHSACRALPSQKTINKRKADAKPGTYPEPQLHDPSIPCLIHVNHGNAITKRASWTILLPWNAVQAVWYSLIYHPLSTGGQVRFGGQQEQRQLAFEASMPWFPGDYPGTEAGDAWEVKESARRQAEWTRRPKSKRVNYETLQVNPTTKGEIGAGWACDWARLINAPPRATIDASDNQNAASPPSAHKIAKHLPSPSARSILQGRAPPDSVDTSSLMTVQVTLLGRGVADPCARIYRLPEACQPPTRDDTTTPNTSLRDRWLALLYKHNTQPTIKQPPRTSRVNADMSLQTRQLARDLLTGYDPSSNPNDDHPPVPDECNLIGFITTGEFSLTEGRGIGIGSILIGRVLSNVSTRTEFDASQAVASDIPSRDSVQDSTVFQDTTMLDADTLLLSSETNTAAARNNASDKTSTSKENKCGANGRGSSSSLRDKEMNLCIVRNSGETVGRLARWRLI